MASFPTIRSLDTAKEKFSFILVTAACGIILGDVIHASANKDEVPDIPIILLAQSILTVLVYSLWIFMQGLRPGQGFGELFSMFFFASEALFLSLSGYYINDNVVIGSLLCVLKGLQIII